MKLFMEFRACELLPAGERGPLILDPVLRAPSLYVLVWSNNPRISRVCILSNMDHIHFTAYHKTSHYLDNARRSRRVIRKSLAWVSFREHTFLLL